MAPPSFLDEFIPLDRTFHELALEAGAGDDVDLTRLLGRRDALHWPNLLNEYRVILLVAVGTSISPRPPGRRRRSPAPGSHRTWRADFPHHDAICPLGIRGRASVRVMSEPSEIEKMREQWQKDQPKPMSMVELAKQWTDAIKVIGSGNEAGLLAAGAGLNTFAQKPVVVTCLKCSAASFFVGVFAFVAAFYCVQAAVFAHDEMAQATLHGNLAGIHRQADRSAKLMNVTNLLVIVATIAFLLGCAIACVVLAIV
jgi:hypothetical protein